MAKGRENEVKTNTREEEESALTHPPPCNGMLSAAQPHTAAGLPIKCPVEELLIVDMNAVLPVAAEEAKAKFLIKVFLFCFFISRHRGQY